MSEREAFVSTLDIGDAMPDRICIRPAGVDDAPEMARVGVDIWRAAHRGQVPDSYLDTPPLFQAYDESEHNWCRTLHEIAMTPASREQVFLALDAGNIVGIGMGVPRSLFAPEFAAYAGEVNLLYVVHTHQRRGIGRRLLKVVFEHLVMAGMSSILIRCLTVNAPARRFYEALGGRVVGEHTDDDGGILLPMTLYGWAGEDVARLLRGI
jgi:GNAT superfamily N-acetyltransferase